MRNQRNVSQERKSDIVEESLTSEHLEQRAIRDSLERIENALGQGMQEGDVFIMSGANSQPFPVATRSVGEVRTMLREVMNIGPAAIALLNGNPVSADHVLQQGDLLEFTKESGEKGGTLLLY